MPKLNRNGVNLYFEVHGSGPALILTHGYSATSQMWKGQIEPLSKKHKLIVWDMRGHGRSDYPDDVSAYSEDHTVADIAALLDEAGAKTAIVGGLSLGGYMSLAFYRRHPERVRSLLIIDTGPGFRCYEGGARSTGRAVWQASATASGSLPSCRQRLPFVSLSNSATRPGSLLFGCLTLKSRGCTGSRAATLRLC